MCVHRHVGEHQHVNTRVLYWVRLLPVHGSLGVCKRLPRGGPRCWGAFLPPGDGMLFLALAQGSCFNIYLSSKVFEPLGSCKGKPDVWPAWQCWRAKEF